MKIQEILDSVSEGRIDRSGWNKKEYTIDLDDGYYLTVLKTDITPDGTRTSCVLRKAGYQHKFFSTYLEDETLESGLRRIIKLAKNTKLSKRTMSTPQLPKSYK